MFEVKVVWVKSKNQYVLRWRSEDEISWHQKVTGTVNRREADRMAGEFRSQLNEEGGEPERISWDEFAMRYEEQHLASLAQRTYGAWLSASNHLARILKPRYLDQITTQKISHLKSKLIREGMKASTITAHFQHLRTAFNWAARQDLMRKAPRFEMPKRARKSRHMRGRPPTDAEVDRMIEACRKVRKQDYQQWQRYIRGMRLSGLRLEESQKLTWEDSEFCIDTSGEYPRFRVYMESEKGNKDRFFPITPDFWDWLEDQPREGYVLQVVNLKGEPMSLKRISSNVSKIGHAAGVLVDEQAERFATVQDLRRAFGTYWARKVSSATLMRMMRHSAIETTNKYYVDIQADDISRAIWNSKETEVDE